MQIEDKMDVEERRALSGLLSLLAGRLTRPAVFGGERTAEDAGGLAVMRMGYALDIAQA